MKMNKNQLATLQELKSEWLKANNLTQSQAWALALKDARNNPKTKDAATYARWLLARVSGMLKGDVVGRFYNAGLNDEHLNTAFKYVWDIK